ncbi:2-oxo-4-hydroxy-4-carboxy-5-ureidoimidazoline decarboxylase [Streptomyces sp. NPDC058200]|uniref:2-oxo-4-hydroxy-4-carboxy-5-ureidoimidazoline decarboxylase n=1 Tax=Streptomyces sp. NPDC058200 TaxID=3346378 RepID=UPI0036EF3363
MLSSASQAGPPDGLRLLNAAPACAAEAAFLTCCGSHRWAQRLAAHRPYADLDTLLAASDEASYDLSHADLTEALADESSSGPPRSAPPAAITALRAAHAAYESSFGHAFVISPDGHRPEEYLDHMLAVIRTRLGHDPDHERAVAADELRRLARGRITRLLVRHPGRDPGHDPGRQPGHDPEYPPETGHSGDRATIGSYGMQGFRAPQ